MEKSLTSKSSAEHEDSPSFSFDSFKSVIEKSEAEENERCSLNRFENKIIFQILRRIIDLKTLCICKAVTKRVASIVRLVDTISFTAPLVNPNSLTDHQIDLQMYTPAIRYAFQGESIKLAMNSLEKFKLVKSLHIQLPSPCLNGLDDCILMKWKLVFGNKKAAPYVFILFVKSISDSKGNILFDGAEPEDFMKQLIAEYCVPDAHSRQRMLSFFISEFAKLEKCLITDMGKRGKLSVGCSRVIHQLRNGLANNTMEVISEFYIPSLKLPVSGYVMKGVNLLLCHRKADTFENIDYDDEFENEEDAAYTEAMREIVENHRNRFVTKRV